MGFQTDKVIVYERCGLLFIYNFHPTNSYTDYRVGIEAPGESRIALSSDEKQYGGFDLIDVKGKYITSDMPWNGRKNFLQARLPCTPSARLNADWVCFARSSRFTYLLGRRSF